MSTETKETKPDRLTLLSKTVRHETDSFTLFSMNIAASTNVTEFVRFLSRCESVNLMLSNARYLGKSVNLTSWDFLKISEIHFPVF